MRKDTCNHLPMVEKNEDGTLHWRGMQIKLEESREDYTNKEREFAKEVAELCMPSLTLPNRKWFNLNIKEE